MIKTSSEPSQYLLAPCCASLSQLNRREVDQDPVTMDPTPSPSLGRLAASSRKRTSATAADNLAVSHRTNHTPWARRNADENNRDPPAGSLLGVRAYPKWDLYHERLLAILWHSCMICSYANAGSELRLSEPRSRDLVKGCLFSHNDHYETCRILDVQEMGWLFLI